MQGCRSTRHKTLISVHTMQKTMTILAIVTVQLKLYCQDGALNDKIVYCIAEIITRGSKWTQKLLGKWLLGRNTTVQKCISSLVKYILCVYQLKTHSAAGLSNKDIELTGCVTAAGTCLSSSSERSHLVIPYSAGGNISRTIMGVCWCFIVGTL